MNTQNLTQSLLSSHKCSSILHSQLPPYSAHFTTETPGNVEVSKAAVVVFRIRNHKNYLTSEVALIFFNPRKHNVTSAEGKSDSNSTENSQGTVQLQASGLLMNYSWYFHMWISNRISFYGC